MPYRSKNAGQQHAQEPHSIHTRLTAPKEQSACYCAVDEHDSSTTDSIRHAWRLQTRRTAAYLRASYTPDRQQISVTAANQQKSLAAFPHATNFGGRGSGVLMD